MGSKVAPSWIGGNHTNYRENGSLGGDPSPRYPYRGHAWRTEGEVFVELKIEKMEYEEFENVAVFRSLFAYRSLNVKASWYERALPGCSRFSSLKIGFSFKTTRISGLDDLAAELRVALEVLSRYFEYPPEVRAKAAPAA